MIKMYLMRHKLLLHYHCHQNRHILVGSLMTNEIDNKGTEVN